MASVLGCILLSERYRQQLNRSPMSAGFQVPALGEWNVQGEGPFLATNMRGAFVATRASREGIARFGFTECPVEDERNLVQSLYRHLSEDAASIRCSTVAEAVARTRERGGEPRSIVVSSSLAKQVLGRDDVLPEGFVGAVGKMQVLVADLPEEAALVALAPVNVGVYVRVGDHVGILVRQNAIMVV